MPETTYKTKDGKMKPVRDDGGNERKDAAKNPQPSAKENSSAKQEAY